MKSKIFNVLLVVGAGLLILTLNSCQQLEKLTEITFGYTYKNDTFPVPVISTTGDMDLSIKLINTNISKILDDNGVSSDHFKNAYIKSINLQMLDTTTQFTPLDFDFISKMKIYIQADGKPKKLIAQKDPIPSATDNFTLDMENIDLVSYFDKSNVQLTFSATVVSPTDHEFMLIPEIRVEFTGDIVETK